MKNQSKAQFNDLCEKLNMDFDEANELFGSETLDGMKMARICGAGDYWGSYDMIATGGGYTAYIFGCRFAGGGDAGTGIEGFDDILVKTSNGLWMQNGRYVREVEIGQGTYTYSYMYADGSANDFGPSSESWYNIMDAIRNGDFDWL